MSVYIESVILDNFLITLFIGKLSYRALSLTRSRLRQYLAALVGTAIAVLYPLLPVSAAVLLAIKCILAVLLCLILFFKKTRLIKAGGMFLSLTFAFGGALFAIGYFVYADVDAALRVPISELPIGLVLLGGMLCAVFFGKIVSRYKKIRTMDGSIFALNFEINSKRHDCRAFLDTGNHLYDPKTDLPVIVLGQKLTLSVLDDAQLGALVMGKIPDNLAGAHYIPFVSAGQKNGRLLIVKPKEIQFFFGQSQHTIKNVWMGLSLTQFSGVAEYDALLHPAVVPMQPTVRPIRTS